MRSSVFCGALAGGGWGTRLIHAMACGCIPIIMTDDVRQPGEDLLPYGDFSLRIAADEVDDLEVILKAIPPAEVRRLQRGVRRWHRYFYWEGNGLAYNLTVMALQRRAVSVLSLYHK